MYICFQLPNTAVYSVYSLAKNLTLKSMNVSIANKYRKTVMLYYIMKYKPHVDHVRNVMAHAQKPDLVFQQNGRVHLNRRGVGQFSRLLAVEQCGSADRPWIDHVPTYSARLLATHSISIFPLNFPSRASTCAIRFRTAYTEHIVL